jgi:hypothetical protein
MSNVSEDVAVRAYQLFLSRGGEHGRDVDDWLEAERELKSNAASPKSRKAAPGGRAVRTSASRLAGHAGRHLRPRDRARIDQRAIDDRAQARPPGD